MAAAWTTPRDIEARVRKLWGSGELLRDYASGRELALTVPLRGPVPSQIGDDLGAVQQWVTSLESGAGAGARTRYVLERASVGGRVVGRNLVPTRAVVSSYDQAWTLLGVRAEVAAYDAVLTAVSAVPEAREWALAHPLRALEVGEEWPRVLAAYDWLRTHRGSGRYLREISAPGVDTKVVARHRGVLAALLGTSPTATGFAARVGFREKPATVRLRFNEGFLGLPYGLTEATFRLEELAGVRVAVPSAVIVENEITYLCVPVPTEGVVIWGEGFRVSRPGSLPWLREAEVHYWGDLDTHGFAILHQLRAWLPSTRSLLMDGDTLLAHRDRWGREPDPTAAVLDRLNEPERELYGDLVSGRYGDRLRLEQERIDWGWVEARWPLERPG